MPLLSSCCGCVSLKTGSVLIASFDLLASTLVILLSGLCAVDSTVSGIVARFIVARFQIWNYMFSIKFHVHEIKRTTGGKSAC